MANQKGVYSGLGMPSASNIPGARGNAVAWTDTSGNFWLFGGSGYDSAGTLSVYLNDLWRYNNGQWTWMSGSDLADQTGFYGVQGTANPNNFPGGRDSSTVLIDAQGNLWLFGGSGYDATTTLGDLNDLWKYEP